MPYPLKRDETLRRVYPNLPNFFGKQQLCRYVATQESKNGNQHVTRLPWVVPVLGSGALDGVVAWSVDGAKLAKDVASVVAGFGATPEGSDALATIAGQFVKSLVDGRQRAEIEPSPVTPTVSAIDVPSARLALAAALLTRYCHAGRAILPSSLQRSSDEEILVDNDPKRPGGVSIADPYHLEQTTREPLLAQLRLLETELRHDTKYKYLCPILEDIGKGLEARPRRVTLNWVRILTEATWLKLVDGPNEYYGWSEMLLSLILNEERAAAEIGEQRTGKISRRPIPNPEEIGAHIVELFEQPTRTSLENAEGSAVHTSVAKMLCRQASLSSDRFGRAGPERAETQRALALSVSFDLELEAALLRLGSGYHVAIPLHVVGVHGSYDEAELLWVVGTVLPTGSSAAERFDAMRNPLHWKLLSRDTMGTELQHELPLIVRLSGCPLIDLSSASTALELKELVHQRWPRSVRAHWVRAIHAVCADEHVALRAGQAEALKTTDALDRSAKPDLDNLGQVFGASRNPEYFTFLGVPLDDDAVLQRVVSVLTVRWMQRKDGTSAPTESGLFGDPRPSAADDGSLAESNMPERLRGVAVNSRLDLDAASLLGWMGVAVVSATCRELIPHLEHYADHVLSDGAYHPIYADVCTLSIPGMQR